MNQQTQSWWLDNKLHYAYLAFSISFLIILSLFEEQGILVHALLLIHLFLMLGKLFCNPFMMALFFRTKRPKNQDQRLSEKTLKFAPYTTNLHRDERYRRTAGVEDVLFGNRGYNDMQRYSRNYSMYNQMQNGGSFKDREANQFNSYNRNSKQNELRSSLYKNPILDSRQTYNPERAWRNREGSPLNINENRISNSYFQRESSNNLFEDRPISKFQFRTPQKDQRGRSQYYNVNREQLMDFPQRGSYQQNQPTFQQNQMFEKRTDRIDNLDKDFRMQLYHTSIRNQIRPLLKQFSKYGAPKEVAIDLILQVRRYFDDKIRQYKAGEESRLERLRVLMKQLLGQNYEPYSSQALISKARQLVTESEYYRSRPEIVNNTYGYDRESKSRTIEELKQLMSLMYFSNISSLNSKQQLMRFYKQETIKNILPNVNLQIIVNNEQVTGMGYVMSRFVHQIYYSPQTDFCYFNKDQQNHIYNLDQTFLLLILSLRKEFSNSILVRELNIIINSGNKFKN